MLCANIRTIQAEVFIYRKLLKKSQNEIWTKQYKMLTSELEKLEENVEYFAEYICYNLTT